MKKTEIIQGFALCSGVIPVERLSFASSATSDIGYFVTAYPVLIYQVQNKSKGDYSITSKNKLFNSLANCDKQTCNGMTKRWSVIIGGLANPSVRNNS